MAKEGTELLFEPTGDLVKDYSAYCEIEDKQERDDFLEGIQKFEVSDSPAGTNKQRTNIVLRNLDQGLYKRDSQPLINAIPHCLTLQKVLLTNCSVTEHTYKLLVEALYKSPTITTLAVDFNGGGGLMKDPTVTKKDKNEIMVNPAHYRGQHLKLNEPEVKEEKKGGKDAKKPVAKVSAPVQEEPVQDKPLVPIPTGWHAIMLTGIQHLSLRGNAITDQQVQLFCPMLETNTELLALSLWGNSITSVGAAAIAKALTNNRKLTALNLGHNRIDDAGVAALAKIFFTQDTATVEEALKLRQKVYPTQTELPHYPTYGDLCAAAAQPIVEAEASKKDPKKKEAPKAKGAPVGPVERQKGDFDRDCVKLSDHSIRVPGNWTLWSLNLSHNADITPQGVQTLVSMLKSTEPNYEQLSHNYPGINAPGAEPATFHVTVAPYVATIALEHLDLTHPKLDKAVLTELADALAAKRASQATLSPVLSPSATVVMPAAS